ncbi:MAG: dihydroorotase [Paramuribaculum sp.]|nr:dihydroorotase [Paramuribaculum sp.]
MKVNEPTLLIHNAVIVNEGEAFEGYLSVAGDVIAEVGRGVVPEDLLRRCSETEAKVIDTRGHLLLPGIIDTHVHFREPGLTDKADIASESRAAVMGGVTSFIDMPNTKPATTTRALVEEKMQRAAETSMANYGFFIGATDSNLDELAEADYTRIAAVKLFMGSSTGNMLMADEEALRRLVATDSIPLLAVHAEDEALLEANRRAIVERYGEQLPMEFHPVIRNHQVCVEATRRISALCREYSRRLHLLHISTGAEADMLSDAPLGEKLITAETCPQYLAFSDEQYAMLGARIKCNPAIKRPADREALLRAVADGRIDTIATDHAPHLLEQKCGTALTAVSGMPLIQFSLTLMLQMVEEGMLDLKTVIDKMAHNPARIYAIDRRGFLRPGYFADFTIVDNDCEPYTITDAWAASKCGWTPLAGLTVGNRVEMTVVNGSIVYRHGLTFSTSAARPLSYLR